MNKELLLNELQNLLKL